MDTRLERETEDDNVVTPYLSRYLPLATSLNPLKKFCFRHRPDSALRHRADGLTMSEMQRQLDELPLTDRQAISQVWSVFSASPAPYRLLILKGLLAQCCFPQLSFIHGTVPSLLRVDFIAYLPHELSLKILSYLDAKSLCQAARVSQTWKQLADDDCVWHLMCKQHIDKKCIRCGWGLPLMDPTNTGSQPIKRSIESLASCPPECYDSSRSYGGGSISTVGQSDVELQTHHHESCSSNASGPPLKRIKSSAYDSSSPMSTPSPPPPGTSKRSWKEIYSERLVVERNWRKNNHRRRVFRGHKDGVMALQLDECKNLLITGGYDCTVKVWDLMTGECIRTMTGHTRCVRALQFDSCKLVTGSMDKTLRIWNYHTGKCIRVLEAHTDGIVCLHFNKQILASGSVDTTAKVYNFATGECFSLYGHTDWVNHVIIFEQHSLLTASDDTTIRIFDLTTRSCTRVFRGHLGPVQSIAISPKSFEQMFRMEANLSAQAPDPQPRNPSLDGLLCAPSLPPQQAPASSTSIATEDVLREISGPILISGSLDNTIKIWSYQTGECLRTLFGHLEGVWSVQFDRLRLVSSAQDRSIKVWDWSSGKCLQTLLASAPVNCVALSDTKIVSGAEDGDVYVFDYGVKR
ncbi:uncharacterized protein VTP21DRAFT_2460 [Calcarisporiella thermophila]|uniref:uncharacterized protein n=1 Tax=Calcarisporiella thermophila TaxID=911321 RepID=UPI003742421B